jgi:hypothetical protein
MKTTRPHCPERGERRGVTPEIAFAAAAFAVFVTWSCLMATVPAQHVMPAIATMFLIFATGFGVVAWRYRDDNAYRVTYADVAGALTLIGLFAAATIDPDHLVRIITADAESQN